MTATLPTSPGIEPQMPLDDRLLLEGIGTDVVIVGAGPGGAALGYLLASRGIRTVVVERHRDFSREFRGEGLQPSGRECIREMGLDEAFSRVPQTRLVRSRWQIRERTVEIPVPGAGLLVSQPAFLEMLAAESATFADYTLLRGTTVDGLLREHGRVTGVTTDDRPREIRARLVVGADGRASVVRRHSDLPLTALDQELDVLWLKADLGDFLPDRETAHMDLATNRSILVYPSPEGDEQLGIVMEKGAYKEMSRPERLQWIHSHASPALRRALEVAASRIVGPVVLKVICDRLDCWSEPGMLLIGDAAHTMSPVGGQGINMALRDAVVAANHLVPAFLEEGTSEAIDRAANDTWAERLPEIAAVQAMQTREGERMLHPSRLLLWLLPLLARLPPRILARANRRRARMRTGLTEVKLRV